ncbi:MAG: hypothetical protein MJK12_15400 [Colwellia sp.]|nr:hypothetical protein [Colwellia sp.]
MLSQESAWLIEVKELTVLINKLVDESSFQNCSSLLAKRLGLLETIKSKILAKDNKDNSFVIEFKETLLWIQQQDSPRLKFVKEQRELCLKESQKQAKIKKAVVAYNSI